MYRGTAILLFLQKKYFYRITGRILPIILLSAIIQFCLLNNHVQAGLPNVSEVKVTDVTPTSFSVIWLSSEPGTAGLKIYDAPGCINQTSSAIINAHPILSGDSAIISTAEDRGVMKAAATGLQGDTDYCYQIVTKSKSTEEESLYPAIPSLVRTNKKVTRTYINSDNEIKPFSNDIIKFKVTDPLSYNDMRGSLVVISLVGGNNPVTAFVGDEFSCIADLSHCYDSLLDLNNLFNIINPDLRENLNVHGGETILIEEYRGTIGTTLNHYRKVPLDNELSEMKDPEKCYSADMDCSGVVDVLDFQRVLNYFNLRSDTNSTKFNYDIDVIKDGEINILDAQHILNRFGKKEPFTD